MWLRIGTIECGFRYVMMVVKNTICKKGLEDVDNV
jgi:hypothetical protein